MENNDNMILSDQTAGKEYQIPELVDLNCVGEAISDQPPCTNGSGAGSCNQGTSGTPPV